MELGIYSFADLIPDAVTGEVVTSGQRMKDLLEEIKLADEVGLDVFGLGEHHRPDYIVSSPVPVLAAAAAMTKNIRLTSAVTVLSSDDPVRVYQNFAELDLISGGRAEIMAGRGSFIESFPLFGYSLEDYDELFAEKLELLLKIRGSEKVTWSGRHRAPLKDAGVYPRAMQKELPVWLAVGGNPQSLVRAGRLGLPLAFAMIGGLSPHIKPLIDAYRLHAVKDNLPVAINSMGYVADDRETALNEYFPYYRHGMDIIGRERGWSPMTHDHFEALSRIQGSLAVGSPEEVAEKILYQYDLFGHQRYLMQTTIATMPHDKVMRSIELLGTKVAPLVKKGLRHRQ